MTKFSSLKTRVSRLFDKKEGKGRILMLILCLALVVGMGAKFALTGLGMERTVKVLNCTVDDVVPHAHSKECYNEEGLMICGKADYWLHKHDANCYNESLELVCGIEEKPYHVHTQNCFVAANVLACGLEETVGHVHTEACYPSLEGVVTCGLEEHLHTDACYDQTYETACMLKEHTHIPGACDSEVVQICELAEHTHSESCGGLTCGQEEHEHREGCYQEVLSCTLDEHTHSEEAGCYTASVDYSALICGREEHIHSVDCESEILDTVAYDEEGRLLPVCGYTDEMLGHTHSDRCYTRMNVLDCGYEEVHVHEDACYEADDVFHECPTCGKLEKQEHEHGPDCISEVKLNEVADKTISDLMFDEAMDLFQVPDADTEDGENGEEVTDAVVEPEVDKVTPGILVNTGCPKGCADGPMVITDDDVTFLVYAIDKNDQTKKVQITTSEELKEHLADIIEVTVSINPNVDLHIEHLEKHGGKIEYQFGKYFDLVRADNTNIKDSEYSDTDSAANIVFDLDENQVTLEFDAENYFPWVEGQNRDTLQDLSFTVRGWFNPEELLDNGTTGGIFGDFTITVTGDDDFYAQYTSLDLAKDVVPGEDGKTVQKDDKGYYVEYQLTVSAGLYGAIDVKVTDSACRGEAYWQEHWLSDAGDGYGPYGHFEEVPAAPDTEGRYAFVSDISTVNGENWGSGLVWDIGTMGPNEERTLTYRVYLDADYVEKNIDYPMFNTAAVQTKDKVLDEDEEKVDFKGIATVKKESTSIRQGEDPNGGGIITYKICIKADENNNHDLDLILRDIMGMYESWAKTSQDLWPFLHYENVRIYDGYFDKDTVEDIEANYTPRSDIMVELDPDNTVETPLEIQLDNLAPGESITILYDVRVDLEAFLGKNNAFDLNNIAILDTQQMPGDDTITGKNENKAEKRTTVKTTKWLEKLNGVKKESTDIPPINFEGDEVYGYPESGIDVDQGYRKPKLDANGKATLEEITGHGAGYTYPPGTYYYYEVNVNPEGTWDVTSWAMKDELGDRVHMKYVGYVEVVGTNPKTGEKRTVWVDVDGLHQFAFDGKQLGFEDGNWSFVLKYYTTPINSDGLAKVEYKNKFSLKPGPGEGGKTIPGIWVEVKDTVDGGMSFTASKQYWYYDSEGKDCSAENGWSGKGALYWVIKIDAAHIPSDLWVSEYIQSNKGDNKYYHVLRPDSIVGGYFADRNIVFGEDLTVDDFLARPDVVEVRREKSSISGETGEYYWVDGTANNPTRKHDIKFPNGLKIPEDKMLYFVVKTDPSERHPSDGYGPVTYTNHLETTDAQSRYSPKGWGDDPKTTLTTSKIVDKKFGSIFYTDGEGKIVSKPYRDSNGNIHDGDAPEYGSGDLAGTTNPNITDLKGLVEAAAKLHVMKYVNDAGQAVPLEAGMYATWVVSANIYGDISTGIYDIEDTIPDGMEVKSVALVGIKNNGNLNPEPVAITVVPGDGWEAHRSTKYPSEYGQNHVNNYNPAWKDGWPYYTNAKENAVKWRVNFKYSGKGDDIHANNAITPVFLITCRVTDEDVILGTRSNSGETSTTFDNKVDVYKVPENGDRVRVDHDSASVTIKHDARLFKDVYLPSDTNVVSFTIEVNQTGEDLEKGNVVTIEDEMSSNIKLIMDSLKLYSSLNPDVEYTGWSMAGNVEKVPGDGTTIWKMKLPDEKHLYLKYQATVDWPSGDAPTTFSNDVRFADHKSTPGGSLDRIEFHYNAGGSVGSSGDPKLIVTKYNATYDQLLQGAEFTLTSVVWNENDECFDERTDQFKYSRTVATSVNGVAVFDTKNENGVAVYDPIARGVIYRLTETKAPGEYMLDDTPRYFIIVDTVEKYDEYDQFRREHHWTEEEFRVTYIPKVEYEITNSRGEIIGTKKFIDQRGNDLQASVIPEGTYTFGLYHLVDGEEKPYYKGNVHYTRTIEVKDGMTDKDFTFTFDDLEAGTYYIYEMVGEEPNMTKVEAGETFKMGGMTFSPQYSDGGSGITVSRTNPSESVTVSNVKLDSYKLPETGGEDVLLYTAGSLLMLGAGLLMILKKREQRHV